MAKVTYPLYKVYSPFVVYKNENVDCNPFTEVDFKEQDRLRTIVTKWCLKHEFIKIEGQSLVPVLTEENENTYPDRVFNMNFRKLAKKEYREAFVKFMRDNEFDTTTNKVIALTIHLITTLDREFLEKHLNKLYYALQSFSPDTDDTPWHVIHGNFPFLWVIYEIHTAMHHI